MEAQSKEDAAPASEEEAMQSFDDHIKQRIRDGARHAEAIAKEYAALVHEVHDEEDRWAALSSPLTAYAENRIRGWVRAIEREAGEQAPPPMGPAETIDGAAGEPMDEAEAIQPAAPPQEDAPPPESAMEARERMLRESVLITGYGFVHWADVTVEHIDLRMAHLQSTISGLEESLHFLRRVRATLVRLDAATVGDIPKDVPFDEA